VLVCSAMVLAEGAEGGGVAASSPATAPADAGAAAATASRLAANFAALMAQNWRPVAGAAVWTVVSAVVWAIVLFVLGIAAAVVGYFLLRRLGLFDAPWSWYRWVRWLWCLLLVVSTSIGWASAGAWWGAGRKVKHYLRDEKVLDRIYVTVAMAAMLDRAGYGATGQETPEQLEKIITDSQAAAREARADWSRFLRETAESATDNFLQRWLLKLAIQQDTDGFEDSILREPKLALLMYTLGPCTEEYADRYPDARGDLMLASTMLGEAGKRACRLVDKVVRPNVLAGIALGPGIPLALAGVFRLILRLAYGRRGGTAGRGRGQSTGSRSSPAQAAGTRD